MRRFIAFLMIFVFSFSAFAVETSPVPDAAKKGEVPTWAKDLRRAEIISLGSLPFMTIWTTLAYTAITKGAVVNPLSNDSGDLIDFDDQAMILGIACSVSLALGLTDFIINLVGRSVDKENKASKEDTSIVVVPLGEAESLIEKTPATQDYLKGGLESAVF